MKNEKLPKAFKKKWLSALRSGKYQQGKQYLLNDNNECCCLGVACEIAGLKHLKGKSLILTNIKGISAIPKLIRGYTTDNIVVKKLTEMNDEDNASFVEIADWIEKNL